MRTSVRREPQQASFSLFPTINLFSFTFGLRIEPLLELIKCIFGCNLFVQWGRACAVNLSRLHFLSFSIMNVFRSHLVYEWNHYWNALNEFLIVTCSFNEDERAPWTAAGFIFLQFPIINVFWFTFGWGTEPLFERIKCISGARDHETFDVRLFAR